MEILNSDLCMHIVHETFCESQDPSRKVLRASISYWLYARASFKLGKTTLGLNKESILLLNEILGASENAMVISPMCVEKWCNIIVLLLNLVGF